MQKLSHLSLNDEGFAFNTTTGQCFLVNETALFILECFRGGKNETEIIGQLTKEYGLSPRNALRDLGDFRDRLKIFGLT